MSIEDKPTLDGKIFYPALFVVVFTVLSCVSSPEEAKSISSGALSWVTHNLDWLFQLSGFGALIYLGWLAYGRYGHVKLGQTDDKPEFSNLSFIAMIFCSGVGSSLIYWAIAEPIYYLSAPPFGAEVGSLEASMWLTAYPMFHWGLSAWALYCLPAVPMAYCFYVRRCTKLRISEGCRGLLGKYIDGPIGTLIDVLGIFGVMGGVGVGLGLGVPLLSAVIQEVTGLPSSIWLDLTVLALWTALFGFSVFSGLYKGIKVLSDVNLILSLGLVIFVIVVGPTAFLLSNASDSLGVMFQHYIRMSLWTDPVGESGFPQDWSVFYWAWYLAYVALMGIFIARISKGRTIRQIITAVIIFGSLGCWLFIWTFGGLAQYVTANELMDLPAIVSEKGMTVAMVELLTILPGDNIFLFFFMIVEFIFMATTIDSSAFVLATMTTKRMTVESEMQPARWNRLFWAFALAGLGLAAILVGGLKAVQSLAVVAGLPMLFIGIIMNVSLMKWLKKDYGQLVAPEAICINTAAVEGNSHPISEETLPLQTSVEGTGIPIKT